jgi:methyl-accepting chemotaxis protein
VEDTNRTGENFKDIAKSIEHIDSMSTQIATAADEQTSVTLEISRNAQAIRDVTEILQEKMVEDLKQAHNLSDMAASLREQICKFKL